MRRQRVDFYKGPTCTGIDVSRWQGEIDWKKVKNSDIKFVFVRTGDGKDTDPRFLENWFSADEAGIPFIGSYHYFRADRNGETQADQVINLMHQVDFVPGCDLPPVLDFEDGASLDLPGGVLEVDGNKLPMEVIVDEAIEFLERIEEKLKVRPLIYTGQTFHWWLSQGDPEQAKRFAKYDLWTPSYVKTAPYMPVDKDGKGFPWTQWTFWQYTAKGTVPGVNTPCDMNVFRGSFAELQTYVEDTEITSPSTKITAPSYDAAYKKMSAILNDVKLQRDMIDGLTKKINTDLSEVQTILDNLINDA